MRSLPLLLACATILCIAAGCGDDECSPCALAVSDQPLAQINIGMGGRENVILSDTLGISFVSSNNETLFNLIVTPADQGTTKMVNASVYPQFTAAAARLSDGVNDHWTFRIRTFPSDVGAGSTTIESGWLAGGYSGGYTPDLHGAEITRIWINLRAVTIDQGSDYTFYGITARIVIMGRP